MSGFIRTASWILCVVYSTIPGFWLLVHHRAAFWRARRRSPYRILLPAWIAMWIGIAVITAPFRHIALYHTPWPWIPALALVATGFYLYLRSSRDFSGHQLTGVPEIRSRASEQTLVTAGIRQRVRHPRLPRPSLRIAGLESRHRPGGKLCPHRLRHRHR